MALETKNVSQALARLDPDEKAIISNDTPGGVQSMLIISEAGLYRLVLSSRKKRAKEFQRWVTHEVLPSIRKTGKYESSPQTTGDLLVQMAERYRDQEKRLALVEERERARDKDLIATQQRVIEGFLLAERAEAKADIALDDAHRMTVEEYIIKNGDTRQYRPTEYQRITKWLKQYCEQWGIEVHNAPVLGKAWDSENAYPLQAFAAFYRYDQKRPQQITLVKEEPKESDHGQQ